MVKNSVTLPEVGGRVGIAYKAAALGVLEAEGTVLYPDCGNYSDDMHLSKLTEL